MLEEFLFWASKASIVADGNFCGPLCTCVDEVVDILHKGRVSILVLDFLVAVRRSGGHNGCEERALDGSSIQFLGV